MSATMKALWLHQPYPTLIALGVKRWETRGCPPNGPMRPDGVRGMPGLAIEPGERVAIVAAVKAPGHLVDVGAFRTERSGEGWKLVSRVGGYSMEGIVPAAPVPLGVVVCTAAVAEALPMVGPETDGYPVIEVEDGSLTVHYGPDYWGEAQEEDISDQLPYGDWTPGRWAWRLADVEPVEPGHSPVVTRGNRQGVCEIEVTW